MKLRDVTVMNSIGDECTNLKEKYESCFNTWFSEKFLRGETDDSKCKELFTSYQSCLKNALSSHTHINLADLNQNHIDGTEFETPNFDSAKSESKSQEK